jgi:threonine/homoserine/homoserine lactone efflux protein
MGTDALLALLVGTVMGFVGSMPVAGPVAVLVLERGLVRRGREGIGVALGAAAGESVYAFLSSWGVGAFFGAYPRILPVSRLVGAGVLMVLGIYLATRRPSRPPPDSRSAAGQPGQKRRGFLLGVSLTLLNPTIIATWTVAVTAIHGAGLLARGLLPSIAFAAGVGVGIVAWFGLLLRLLHVFQKGLRPQTVHRLLQVTGWLVVALGVGLAVRPIAQALGGAHS